jgi:phosphoserine phosphatase
MNTDPETGIAYQHYSLPELEQLVAESETVISDLDETVHSHRPRFDWFYRAGLLKESSNFDLALSVWKMWMKHVLEEKSPKEAAKWAGYCLRNVQLYLKYLNGASQEELISYFGSLVLNGVPDSYIRQAALNIARFPHEGSLETLAELTEAGKSLLLITLGLQVSADAYIKRNGLINGLAMGNGRHNEESEVLPFYLSQMLLTGKDKGYAAELWLSGYENAIVIGNSANDLPMYEALDKLGKRGVKIAVNSRDEELLSKADISANWPSLQRFVSSSLQKYGGTASS